MLWSRLLQWWLITTLVVLPISALANEQEQENTTTTTTTTTIPGEVEEIETFDGPEETTTTTIPEETETTTTTTTTIPEWEQSTDIELPEDELDSQGNEVENNIQIDSNHSNGNWSCCGMTDFHMNLHYFQHGNDSNDYTFTLPETTTVDEEELNIDIYEVGFRIGALNNDGTVTYTHTDETTQVNVLEGQDNTDIENMFEDVVYNIYDTLETFIESFTITINDWSLLDDISFKYIQPTTTTTTTTTLPPPPKPEPEPEPYIPPPPPEPEKIVVILDNGEEAEYEQHEIDDGTVERDNQRKKNLEIYGVELTDEQIERGDLEQYDIEIIEEEGMGELGEEFFDDVDVPDFVEIELTEEELERETKKLELEEEIEIFIFEDEEEIEEFIDTVLEVEEFLEEFEEVEIIIIEDIEDIIIEDIIDELHEEDIRRDDNEEPKVQPLEDITEEIEEIFVEEVVEEEVEELEEIIEIEIEEDLTDEEIEETIEVYVQKLDTEEVVEVLEEVNDIGVQNLEQATEEVQEIVQAVVEEAIEEIEELTEEQVEVVAEVLQVQTEDVEIIAEAVKEDEVVAEAVEEYVERAVQNADVENYTLADVVTEVQYENFLENPIETFVDLDFEGITIDNIGDDMTSDQKEKAQEVVVPVILTRIATMAAFVFRKTI